MRHKLFYIFVIFILIPIHVNSQDNNPIDKELTECMDKNPSTKGVIECVDNAYNKWDNRAEQ